jgi:hypothetical protein
MHVTAIYVTQSFTADAATSRYTTVTILIHVLILPRAPEADPTRTMLQASSSAR